jgi:hypothetical protein
LSKKRQFFANLFGENVFKNHNIGPWPYIQGQSLRMGEVLLKNGYPNAESLSLMPLHYIPYDVVITNFGVI